MGRLFRTVTKPPATSPGTIHHIGERHSDHVHLTVFDFAEDELEEKTFDTVEECLPYRESKQTSWINIDGLHDTDVIQTIGQHYGIHPLVLEDITNTRQRPKAEDFEDYIYLVFRMLMYDEKTRRVKNEQISLVLGDRFVLSFQEKAGDVFDGVRERIRGGKGRLRTHGADYLAYALVDAVVDHYYIVLEKIGSRIEALEEDMMEKDSPQALKSIYDLKREMILLRRAVWPIREVIAGFQRAESRLVSKTTEPFLRDVYDHVVQIVDVIESFRDVLSGMQDLYLSNASNRMNEVMKVLTIIATIFVPLTFFAGIYGMNFEFMPELGWKWAYPLFWLVILLVGGGMLTLFRKARWL